MRHNLLTAIICMLFMAVAIQPARAGFVIIKSNTTEHTSKPADAGQTIQSRRHDIVSSIKARFSSVFSASHSKHKKDRKIAWQDLASFGCSILGFFAMFLGFAGVISAAGLTTGAVAGIVFGLLCGIAALVFGIMGMRKSPKKWKFRGFALAGVILGGLDVFFLTFLLLIAATIS